jgi:hypothetical protein
MDLIVPPKNSYAESHSLMITGNEDFGMLSDLDVITVRLP